ncbi:MAG: hypothetical protein NTY22_05050 [Proteobacteria bacterium]|nr:hypothetical protein [Pseudomonadota bacterium]
MRTVIKILLIFIMVSIASTLLINYFDIKFGTIDYWNVHGFWFLVFISFFPRLTLFFSSVPFGGLFWWLGFIFAPRLLVAILATVGYWNTNKFLVIASWLIAIGGESSEKYYIHRGTFKRKRPVIGDNVIDAEYYEVKK